ncbi:MAG: hypothetical protein GYA87_00715, partial [Christensenellaceae bacterium]|nr:hypothetical protein [Christensenellaceae bacterium]
VKDMVSGFNSFSDRTTIWAAGLNFIKNEPEVLITGTLTDHIMTKVNSFNTKVPKKIFGSIHNSYLDVLIIGGLPSFLLLFIFFIKLLPKQLKLLFCNLSDFKGGNKIFTIMVWSIAAYGMMESNLIYSNGVVNILLFVFLGYSTFMANHYIAQKD